MTTKEQVQERILGTAVEQYRKARKAEANARRHMREAQRQAGALQIDAFIRYVDMTEAIDQVLADIEEEADRLGWAESTRRQRVLSVLNRTGREFQ